MKLKLNSVRHGDENRVFDSPKGRKLLPAYIYIYLYLLCLCVCVCVCMCAGWLCQPKDYCVLLCSCCSKLGRFPIETAAAVCLETADCWLAGAKVSPGPGQRVESSTGGDLRRAAVRTNSFCQDAGGWPTNKQPIWQESAQEMVA